MYFTPLSKTAATLEAKRHTFPTHTTVSTEVVIPRYPDILWLWVVVDGEEILVTPQHSSEDYLYSNQSLWVEELGISTLLSSKGVCTLNIELWEESPKNRLEELSRSLKVSSIIATALEVPEATWIVGGKHKNTEEPISLGRTNVKGNVGLAWTTQHVPSAADDAEDTWEQTLIMWKPRKLFPLTYLYADASAHAESNFEQKNRADKVPTIPHKNFDANDLL